MTTAPDVTIGGDVASGFEPVRDVFAQYVSDTGDGGSAYAAYHEGRKVVDLWTGVGADGAPWAADTLGLWASTTKAMTALCIQILSDRGKLDVGTPIAGFWPEFGRAGKERITTADVMTHRSGVMGSQAITDSISLDDGTGIDRTEDILEMLCEAEPMWEPGTQTGYHTLSYGWLLDGVIRHVDGRDLGAFFREEVALPLGVPDLWIGTPPSEHSRIATIHPMMWPDALPEPVRAYMEGLLALARDPSTPAGVSCLARNGVSILDRIAELFNVAPGRTTPLGGSNMCATAGDVARVFAALADPGGLDGVKVVSSESTGAFTEIRNEANDIVLQIPIARALGYWCNKQMGVRPQVFGPNEEAFGHTGAGGQIGFADPVAGVGVGFVRSHHTSFGFLPLLLNAALYSAVS